MSDLMTPADEDAGRLAFRILVVEDDRDLRQAIEDLLRAEGYVVASAGNGLEALARLRGIGPLPHLVLLDLAMPVMDGWEFLRIVRADAALASLPVVVMSGEPRSTAPVSDHEFLFKPFEDETLLDVLRQQLQRAWPALVDAPGLPARASGSGTPARDPPDGSSGQPQSLEAALEAAESRLDRVQRIAKLGSFEFDGSRSHGHWSDELLRIFELRPDTRPSFALFLSLVHPDDRTLFSFHPTGEGEVALPSRFRLLLPEGRVKHLRQYLEIRRSSSGRVEKVTGLVQDVTAHEEAAAAIRESQLHFETIANSGQMLIWTSGLDGKCNYFNRPWLEFTGRLLEEELGNGWAAGVHPDDLERCLATYTEAFARREPFSMDYRLRHRSGEYRWIQDDGTPRHDSGGRFIGFIGHCLDIHERKGLEASLVQADRLSSMGMLAAGVAHEINNPLAYVLANLESLSQDLDHYGERLGQIRDSLDRRLGPDWRGSLPAATVLEVSTWRDAKERIHEALQGAQRIRDLVRGLGTFSRVENNTVGPVDLRRAAESAISIAANEVKYRARLERDLRATAFVTGSEGRLSQVFLNLLINAAHAIPEGDADHHRIRVSTWQEGDRVFAEVEDTGCGIPPGQLHRLFEPFFTTKPIGKGSGLGLAIVRNIVDEFGGTISVESEVGLGTRFRVEFSTAAAEGPAAGSPPSEPPAPDDRGRVLVIDDEAGVRTAIRRLLRDHEVVEADSGQRAQALLEEDRRFDLVLCDVMMPDLLGTEFHRWLLERAPDLAERLVFLTGGAFTPNARAYLERVQNPRFEKPFDGIELRRRVATWVKTARGGPSDAAN